LDPGTLGERIGRLLREELLSRATPMRATIAVGAVLIAAALTVAPRTAAAQTQAGGNVATVTRLVKIFLDKEQALGIAIRAGDSAVLQGLLTDDFEVRAAGPPAAACRVDARGPAHA
jgi:hypothetical protein